MEREREVYLRGLSFDGEGVHGSSEGLLLLQSDDRRSQG